MLLQQRSPSRRGRPRHPRASSRRTRSGAGLRARPLTAALLRCQATAVQQAAPTGTPRRPHMEHRSPLRPRTPVPCSPRPARARPVTPPLAPRRTASSPAPFATRGGRSASALRSWEWGKTGRNITERRPDRTAAHRRSQPRPPPAPVATSPETGWRLSVAPEGFLVSAPCRCGGPGPRPARIVPPPPRSAQ